MLRRALCAGFAALALFGATAAPAHAAPDAKKAGHYTWTG